MNAVYTANRRVKHNKNTFLSSRNVKCMRLKPALFEYVSNI